MKPILVVVGPQMEVGPEEEYDVARFVFTGTREWSNGVMHDIVDIHERGWQKRVRCWECSEKDVPHVVEQLTKWHGDVEINVYSLATVYYRTPGKLESKAVTKDGVLPF